MTKDLNGLSVLISKGIIFWKCFSFSLLLLSLSVLLFPFFCSSSLAGPTGEQVVSGNITVQRPTSTYTEIQQISDKGIINWQDFSIGIGEHTHFNQPSQSSITLNRVTGSQPSSILGQLTAVGQIILLNRSGVLFGPNATVDVAGLIASTADMTNDDFLSGAYRFSQEAGLSGGIQQQGQITTQEGGYVILVAPHVANSGLIQARLGKVALSSGTEYTVDLQGDQLLQFAVTPSQLTSAVDEKGNPLPQGVFQSGNISASGGTVLMSTQAVHSSINSVISHVGFTEANTLENRQGNIVLSGGPGTFVKISGTLHAKGQKTGEKGGTIKVLGEKIEVGKTAPAKIDVSGPAGGGKILIGGNLQGKGPEPNAKETMVTNQTELLANATQQGLGGQIVVYSEGQTTMQGKAEAKGGPEGGSGGFIETSGETIDVADVQINASAPKGEPGVWLIDPNTLIINSGNVNPLIINPLQGGTSVSLSTVDGILISALINPTVTTPGLFLSLLAGTNTILAGNITIQQPITGNFWLKLNSTGSSKNITDTAAINVYDFSLLGGNWSQIGTGSVGSIPSFQVAHDFNIASTAKFVRFAGGAGTSGNPYLIEDIYGLQGIKHTSLLGLYYSLAQAINASSTATWNLNPSPPPTYLGFQPIGNASSLPGSAFSGNFEGNNYTITGLTINRPNENYVGLFGVANLGSKNIQNLGLIGASITGKSNVGGFIGNMMGGTLSYVYNKSGTIIGLGDASHISSTGGLVGYLTNSTITNSYNFSTISAKQHTGGLVGTFYTNGIINYSYNAGNITAGEAYTGGLTGFSSGAINNTYNIGSVQASSGYTGGLAGISYGSIANSYSSAPITGGGAALIGQIAAGTISNLYWNTTVGGSVPINIGDPVSGRTGLTTAEMKQASQFVGFNIPSGGIWNIVEGITYPFFQWRFLPLSGTSNVLSTSVKILLNGSPTAYVPTYEFGPSSGMTTEAFTEASSGQYWTLLEKTALTGMTSGVSPVLAYLDNISTPGNAVTVYNSAGMNGVDIYVNTVNVMGSLAPTTELSSSFLQQAGSASITNKILYDVDGLGNLTLTPGTSLRIDTPYNLTGTVTTTVGGNLTFTSNAPVTLGTNADLISNSIVFNNTVNGPYALILEAAGNIDWKGIVGGIQPLTTIHILGANNVINEQQLYANSFIQDRGTGTTYLSGTDFGIHYPGNPNSTQFVQLGTGTANIITNALTGNIFANNLFFWTPTIADLGGSIAGLGPEPSALRVAQSLLGPIGPGTHFFENIDLYLNRSNFYLTLLPYFPTYYSREVGGVRFDSGGSYFNEPYDLFGTGIILARDQLESYQPSISYQETKMIVYKEGRWWIQIETLATEDQAIKKIETMKQLGFAVRIEKNEKDQWIILVGPYLTRSQAKTALQKLETYNK